MQKLFISVTVLLLSGATTAQTTVGDLLEISALEQTAKRCAALGDASRFASACKKTSAQPIQLEANPAGKKVSKAASITVLAAWGTPDDASAEIAINEAVRVMKQGDVFQGWTLQALDSYSAKFQSGKEVKTIFYRSQPKPAAAAASAGVLGASPSFPGGPVIGLSPIPAIQPLSPQFASPPGALPGMAR